MYLAPKRSYLLDRVFHAFSKISPLSLAEAAWDNVGVLIESHETWSIMTPKARESQKSIILLTIDINHKVIDEALQYRSSSMEPIVIVSYHPMVFKPIKKLTLDPLEDGYSHINELAVRCIQQGISVFSPHTALDNCHGGINDWICSLIGKGTVTPIFSKPLNETGLESNDVGSGRYLALTESISIEEVANHLTKGFGTAYGKCLVLIIFHSQNCKKYRRFFSTKIDFKSGCLCGLRLVSRKPSLFTHLGGSILLSSKLHQDTDLLVTGEMGHHDILAATAKGHHVMLFEHSHTERNYLSEILKPRLESILKDDCNIHVFVSKYDKDPIEIYEV